MAILKRVVSKQLGELLRERNIITETQLAKALAAQREKGGLIGEILISLGFAREDEIAQALAIQYGFPYLPLDNYEIDTEAVKIIPLETARKLGVIPIDKMGSTLTVAMMNPLNCEAVQEIEALTKCNLQLFVTTATSFENALKKYYGAK